MERIKTAIIGGGAAGLFLSSALTDAKNIAIFERGERLGRKLSATGNGQGNVTNTNAEKEDYFSSSALGISRAKKIVSEYGFESLISHLETLGLLLTADERGRVYPAGRQASALTDALRFHAAARGVQTYVNTKVTGLDKGVGGFLLTVEREGKCEKFSAENVVLCTGGKAAKNFGSDGSAYALAQNFGHTLTPLFPSLVQMKTDTSSIKTLKGIRVLDAGVTAEWNAGKESKRLCLNGDVIFTDYGVSGDAIFRLSAFVSDKIQKGVRLFIDFLPDFAEEKIHRTLISKRENNPDMPIGELLCGIVNNQIGRAVMKFCGGDLFQAAKTVKAFPLNVTGTLGFDYAQVTKGGIPLEETDENLQSKLVKNLYFAGEILDVDGQCGGFNLQWAYSSANVVARAIQAKERGQV